MFNKNSDNSLATGAIAAAVGAGVAVSFGIAMGQSPWLGLGIVAFSTVIALLCDRLGWV